MTASATEVTVLLQEDVSSSTSSEDKIFDLAVLETFITFPGDLSSNLNQIQWVLLSMSHRGHWEGNSGSLVLKSNTVN